MPHPNFRKHSIILGRPTLGRQQMPMFGDIRYITFTRQTWLQDRFPCHVGLLAELCSNPEAYHLQQTLTIVWDRSSWIVWFQAPFPRSPLLCPRLQQPGGSCLGNSGLCRAHCTAVLALPPGGCCQPAHRSASPSSLLRGLESSPTHSPSSPAPHPAQPRAFAFFTLSNTVFGSGAVKARDL